MSQGASSIRVGPPEFHPIHADQHAPSKLDQQVRQLAQNVWNAVRPGEKVPHEWTQLNFDKLVQSGGFVPELIAQLEIKDPAAVEHLLKSLRNEIAKSGLDDITKSQLMDQLHSKSGRDSPDLEYLDYRELTPPPAIIFEDYTPAVPVSSPPSEGIQIHESYVDTYHEAMGCLDKIQPQEGVSYLREKMAKYESLPPAEQKALTEFIIEYTSDQQNDTRNFYLYNHMRTDFNSTIQDQYEFGKEIAQQFWPHTEVQRCKAKIFLEFLGRASGINENIEINSPNSASIETSGGGTITQIPLEYFSKVTHKNLDMSGVSDTPKPVHTTEAYKRDIPSSKIVVNNIIFEPTGSTDADTSGIHEAIVKAAPQHFEMFELGMTQKPNMLMLTMAYKYGVKVNKTDPAHPGLYKGPENMFSNLFRCVEIETHDGISYCRNKVPYGFKASIDDENPKKVCVFESVMVGFPDGRTEFYIIDNGLMDPPPSDPDKLKEYENNILEKTEGNFKALQNVVNPPKL